MCISAEYAVKLPNTTGMDYNIICRFMTGDLQFEGTPSLDTKFCLKDVGGNVILDTLIPVERIESMKISGGLLEIRVYPSIVTSYSAFLWAEKKFFLKKIAVDISKKVNLKKNFLRNEWHGKIHIR